ncbi:MAG TPA: hypothetical protein VG734_16240 [Lacunisphaera sp.]|nr:hypothetical protein [Lacunisphaera sp.]
MQSTGRQWAGFVHGLAVGMALPVVCFVAGAAVDTPGRENPWELVMACGFGAAYLVLASLWLAGPGRSTGYVLAGAVTPLGLLGLVGGVLEKPGVGAVVLGVLIPACLLGGALGAALKNRLVARRRIASAPPGRRRGPFWLSVAATALVAATAGLCLYLAPVAGRSANPNTGFFVVMTFVEAAIAGFFWRAGRPAGPGETAPGTFQLLGALGSFLFGLAVIGIGLVVARAPVLLPADVAAWLAGGANLGATTLATGVMVAGAPAAPVSEPYTPA